MNDLYQFLAGPALRVAFFIFAGGLILRVGYIHGSSRECGHRSAFADFIRASRSFLRLFKPPEKILFRSQPLHFVAFYIFYLCLPGVPLFLTSHNTLFREAFGHSLPSMSDRVGDTLALVFIITAAFLLLRKIIHPKVPILSRRWDHFLLILSLLPFVTGYLAYHQIGSYKPTLILHIIFAEILLIAIPFRQVGTFPGGSSGEDGTACPSENSPVRLPAGKGVEGSQ